jgi:hypothetical protein
MTWLQRYRLTRTLRWSLWLLPALSIGLVFVVAPLLRWLDRITGWNWFNFTPDGARRILGAFMPPQHGKSELVSRRFPAFMLGLNPDLRLICASHTYAAGREPQRRRAADHDQATSWASPRIGAKGGEHRKMGDRKAEERE